MRAKKRADGRYAVYLDVGDSTKRKRKVFYGTSKGEAIRKRDAWIDAHPAQAPASHIDDSVSEWARTWYALYNADIAPRTHARKSVALRSITDWFGDMKLTDVRPSHVQAYMNTRAGKSKGDISLHKGLLVGMFGAAAADHVIADDPTRSLRTPKSGEYHGHRALTEREQAIVAEAIKHHRAGVWAALMMWGGLRREEMAGLMWDDIDFGAGTITISRASELDGKTMRTTKTDAGKRVVPIVPPLRDALTHVDRRASYVCVSAGGQPLTLTSYRQGWKSFMLVCLRVANGLTPYDSVQGWRHADAANDFSCTAHDLRYTYATILYDAGVDVKTAQYLLGHADACVTMRIYTKLSERKKAAGIDALMAHFQNDGSQMAVKAGC